MSNAVYLGHHAKVKINNVSFRVISGQYEIMAEVSETTDTEAAVNANNVVGKENSANPWNLPLLGEIQWQLELQVDLDTRGGGPTSALRSNYGIQEGAQVTNMFIYPTGVAGTPVAMPYAAIERMSGSFVVAGGRPQTVRLSGRSQGPYTHP
jgi:hypothetical protein